MVWKNPPYETVCVGSGNTGRALHIETRKILALGREKRGRMTLLRIYKMAPGCRSPAANFFRADWLEPATESITCILFQIRYW